MHAVGEFNIVYTRRKLKVNAVESKGMVFERREIEVKGGSGGTLELR